MHAVVRRVLLAGAIAGGAVVGGAAVAQADGLLSGNDVGGAVVAPVRVCGVAVAVGGGSSSSCDAATGSATTASGGGSTAGDDAVASGNHVGAGAVVPVQVCGVPVGVLGDAGSSCGEASDDGSAGDGSHHPSPRGDGSQEPVGSGNDADLPGTAPVQVRSMAAGVLGTDPGTDPALEPGVGSSGGGVLGDEVVADRTRARAVVQAPALAGTGASLSRTTLPSVVALLLMALGGLMVRAAPAPSAPTTGTMPTPRSRW